MIRAHKYLLLEDDSILPGDVLVAILKGLNLLDLFQVEVRSVRDQLNLELISLWRSIVRGNAFDEKRVALATVRLEDEVFKLGDVVESLGLCLGLIALAGLSLINESQPHVLEEVLVVRNVHSEM